ncbi:acetyltransferase [Rhodocaloribacter litoris]|uniref:acetyltransferase n=1 Tax=Rhodocaloribacter litoris TaxID=2558931 RepID=UPI00141E414D|nr:acetyltransferase [Rhodocaloribacter litoris]QXD14331.1 acetyltransferase [Rhodocaloribacter litoris]
MEPLVIVGAGGFGRETAALVEAINRHTPAWTLQGFVDDDPALAGQSRLGYPLLGDVDWLLRQEGLHYVLAVGNPQIRRRLARRLAGAPLSPARLVHPEASVHPSSSLGAGSIICRGVTVTVDARIGTHVLLNLHSTVGHDAILGDYTTVHPGVHVSGHARTGAAVELGTGCVLLPGVHVGDETRVGAGAVVVRDLPENITAVGVPARPISH